MQSSIYLPLQQCKSPTRPGLGRLCDLPGGDEARLAAVAGPLDAHLLGRLAPTSHTMDLVRAILEARGVPGS